MKFVEHISNVGRTGILSEFRKPFNSETFKTPMFMTYARAGSIPHLTYNSLKYINQDKMFMLQTLPTVIDFRESVQLFQKGLSEFVGLPEFLYHLTVQDPAILTPSGYNVKKGSSVWSYGGKKLITVKDFMEIVKTYKPISYQALCDSDTPFECSNKRLTKSLENSIRFLDECLEEHNFSDELRETAVFGTIEGGYDINMRKKSAQLTASRNVDGFVIDGFHLNGPETENINFDLIKPILLEIIPLLPKEKPRILNGVFNYETIISAVKCGVDIFDSSYAFHLSEAGEASVFPLDSVKCYFYDEPTEKRSKITPKIALKNEIYKDDFSPILEDCKCYACTNYSRAYINHLLVTSELLAQIILMIHNLHHMTEFFETIQKAIES